MPKKTLVIRESTIRRLVHNYIKENERIAGPTANHYLKLKANHPEAAEQWQVVNDAQYKALKSALELARVMKDVEGMKRIMARLANYR